MIGRHFRYFIPSNVPAFLYLREVCTCIRNGHVTLARLHCNFSIRKALMRYYYYYYYRPKLIR